MQDQTVSPAGVHVAGSFQSWDPTSTQLSDLNQDGVYEVTLSLSPGFYEFKFINGNSWDHVESVPPDCQEAGSGHSNRYLSVSSDSIGQSVHVCFGGCACIPLRNYSVFLFIFGIILCFCLYKTQVCRCYFY